MNLEELKQKAKKMKDDIILKGAKAIEGSSMVISDLKKLEESIEKNKKIIIIFALKESDFFKRALYELPVLYTKSWSQNIGLKISNIDLGDLKDYNILDQPTLTLFENKKQVKSISGEESIKKIVKTLDLDINKVINNL